MSKIRAVEWCTCGNERTTSGNERTTSATSELTCQRAPQNPRNRCPELMIFVYRSRSMYEHQSLSIVCVKTRWKPEFCSSEICNFLQKCNFRGPISWYMGTWFKWKSLFSDGIALRRCMMPTSSLKVVQTSGFGALVALLFCSSCWSRWCFQEWLEHKIFKAVLVIFFQLDANLGCFPTSTKKVWSDSVLL